jgi:hypothetical protein
MLKTSFKIRILGQVKGLRTTIPTTGEAKIGGL